MPAREEEGADAEAGEDLRQLRRMAEAVGQVAGAARLDPEAAADPAAEQEVADERLAADEDLVRQDVRRADLEAPGREQRPQPSLVLRPHLDVVLEHDRLPVERERREGRVALERVEHAVDDRAEPQPEELEGQVPLAVPVRVRDDEEAEVGDLGHRRSLLVPPIRSTHAVRDRPLRPRRHRRRLRRDHPRLDAARDARGARPRVLRRGADADRRRAGPRGADARARARPRRASSSTSTAPTTSRSTTSSRPARGWRTCSRGCTRRAGGSAS